ncbi:WD40-repeat-containing domain protein [Phlebopus sp. FC_14]|nr:WD40-repeat-containing domain protein [Phlebopus sp. FC_14]
MVAFDTLWPADSVEFCPHEGAQDVLVCGTYKLEQQSASAMVGAGIDDTDLPRNQVRRGKCLVFQVFPDATRPYSKIQEIALPAVLDQKWCHQSPSGSAVLAIAGAEGGVALLRWSPDQRQLLSLQEVSCAPSHVLCLSLDWSNRRYLSTDFGSSVVSLSDGSLSLLRPSSGGELVVSSKWHAHDYEPWVAAWNYWDSSVVYSGGDDLKMKGWDTRQGFNHPIFINKRFDAGITAIQSHPHIEHLIATGSYDNKVRLFDTRKPLIPLMDVDVGGGAWRVKWHPFPERKHDILVACMHDGFKVVRLNPSAADQATGRSMFGERIAYETVKRYDKHESLAYGVDWSFDHQNGEGSLVASCSFYDHTLRFWRA